MQKDAGQMAWDYGYGSRCPTVDLRWVKMGSSLTEKKDTISRFSETDVLHPDIRLLTAQ